MTTHEKTGTRNVRTLLIILLCIIAATTITLAVVLPNKGSDDNSAIENGSQAASPSSPQGSDANGTNFNISFTSPQEEITPREQTNAPTTDSNNVGETKPTLSPTSPPISSTESEPTRCPDQLAAYEACFANIGLSNDQQISCMDCADQALGSSSFDSCNSFVESFCPSLNSCTDCGSCASLMDDYYRCAVIGPDCTEDCSDDSSSNVAAADFRSSPVVEQYASTFSSEATRCPDQLAAFDTCVANNKLTSDQQISCMACADNALQQSSTASCDVFVAGFCPAMSNCVNDCGGCVSLLDNYYICATVGLAVGGTCNTDCANLTVEDNKTKPKRVKVPKKPGRTPGKLLLRRQ